MDTDMDMEQKKLSDMLQDESWSKILRGINGEDPFDYDKSLDAPDEAYWTKENDADVQ
jgi:hypothetical protein